MDVFGPAWEDHARRLAAAWSSAVSPDDTVLIPGDVSWAMKLEDAAADLALLGSLPGRKVILRGNHDYWWGSLSKVRAALPAGCEAIQNDFASTADALVAGTRGWHLPGSQFFDPGRDEAVLAREVQRLDMSLGAACGSRGDGRPLIVMMHFPPSGDGTATAFTDRIAASGAALCIYGHLHGPDWPPCPDFELDGVPYRLVSADWLEFTPLLLDPFIRRPE
jgi:hypothetical protein